MTDVSASNSNHGGPDPAPRPMAVNLPVEIGGYQIQRVLGAGGMATVYAALQKQPRRTVALKVMKAGVSLTRGDSAYRRFKREIEILGKLRHPYIAQVFGAGMHDDGSGGGGAVPYFVMEYIPGAKTILEYVAAKQLDVRERLKLFVKVCSAVEHGHRHKVIHRDLKPANILIDQFGEPKVIDFGVAQAAELDVATQTMTTDAGRLVGTLQYMSPEQLDVGLRDLDPRCDVYALGVLLYKMLTGRPPHDLEALPVYEAVRVIREETPPPPSEVRAEIRGDLETIILKAIDPDRVRRYHNAGSLGRDMIRYLADKPINARRASLVHRARLFARRHRTALVTGGIVAAVMAAALGIVIYDRGRMRAQPAPAAITQANPGAPTSIPSTNPTGEDRPAAALHEFTLAAHTARVSRLAFLPGGNRLASAAWDHSVIVWDMAARRPLFTATEFDAAVRHLALSADGAFVAACGDRGPIRIIDARSADFGGLGLSTGGRTAQTLRPEGGAIQALALNTDGSALAFALDDLTLRVEPTNAAPPAATSPAANPIASFTVRSVSGAFTCAAFSADGRLIAAGSQRGAVYLWSAADGSLLVRGDDLQQPITTIGFVPGAAGQWLAAVAENGSAMLWPLLENDPGQKNRFTAITPPNATVADATISNGGQWLICCSGTIVSVTNLVARPLKEIRLAVKSDDMIAAVAVDPAGTWCAVGFANGDIRVLPLRPP